MPGQQLDWRALEATAVLRFDLELAAAAGFEIVDLPVAAGDPARGRRQAAFRARPRDEIRLLRADDVYLGAGEQELIHEGGFVLRLASGEEIDLRPFAVVGEPGGSGFLIRAPGGETTFTVGSVHVRFDLEHRQVWFRNADVRISMPLARRLGRPHLAGLTVGGFDLFGRLLVPEGTTLAVCPYDPISTVDLELLALETMSQRAREAGSHAALAVSASLTNHGPGTIEWHRAIAPDGSSIGPHPFLTQSLYRLDADGGFRQIGRSDVKHAFYAVNSGCPCSGGHRLYAGCDDVYGVSNNSDPLYLAPRSEVTASTASWSSLGSHFDVYPDAAEDDYRSHGGDLAHDDFEHRLLVAEAELCTGEGCPRFFVQAWNNTPRDSNPWNNLAHREVTPSFAGSLWSFTLDPGGTGSGPAIDAWVDPAAAEEDALSTTLDSGEGRLRLASRVTTLPGGDYRYDYALFNLDFDRGVDALTVPAVDATSPAFQGAGGTSPTPWPATAGAETVSWQAGDGDELDWGTTFAFRFVSSHPPTRRMATLGIAEAGSPVTLAAAVLGPLLPLFGDGFETGATGEWSAAVAD